MCLLILRDIHAKLSKFRTRRNECTPVNNLPQNITAIVLQNVVEEKKESLSYYAGLFLLRSVCKAWRAFIDNHPSFWVHTFPAQSASLHSFTIPKTRQLPLQVWSPQDPKEPKPPQERYNQRAQRPLNFSSGPAQASPTITPERQRRYERCQDFLERAETNHWPIKYFQFDGTHVEDDEDLHVLLELPAPQLERLELRETTEGIQTLFDGEAPMLRRVTLVKTPFQSTTQPFASLLHLKLSQTPKFLISELLELLRQSPLLEELVLDSIDFRDSSQNAGQETTSPLVLPHLRSLEMNDVRVYHSKTIIRALFLSNCTRLSVVAPQNPFKFCDLVQEAVTARPSLRGYKVLFTEAPSGRDVVSVTWDNWAISARTTQEPFRRLSSGWQIHTFTDSIPMPPAVSTDIRFLSLASSSYSSYYVLVSADTAFPPLQEVAFECRGSSKHGEIDMGLPDDVLEKPVVAWEGDAAKWMLPKLHIINVEMKGRYPPEQGVHNLLRVARARSDVQGSNAPAPIDAIRIKLSGEVDELDSFYKAIAELREVVTIVEVTAAPS